MFSALIIDGDDEAVAQIREALQSEGFDFTTTDHANEAVALARTSTPDVILLRVELPTGSGFSVCNKLRRSDETKYIPVIMYASAVSDDVFEQHQNLKTHADHYFKLPLDPEALVEAVRTLLPISGSMPVNTSESPDLADDGLEVELEDVVMVDDQEPSHAAVLPSSFHQPTSEHGIALDRETDAAFEALMDDPLEAATQTADDDTPSERPSLELDDEPTPLEPMSASESSPEPSFEASSEPGFEPSPEPAVDELHASEPTMPSDDENVSGETPMDPGSSSSDRSAFKAQREVIQLKTQLNATKREILGLREELESRERAVLDAKHKNRELLTQIGDLEEKLINAEERLITAQEHAEAAAADKQTILKREEGLKNRLDLAQKKIRDLEEQLEQQAARVDQTERQANERVSALQHQLHEALDAASNHSGELDNLRSELAEAKLNAEQFEERARHASQELESVLQATSRLEHQLEQSQQSLEAARQQAAMELQQRLEEAAASARAEKEAALQAQAQEHQRELEFEEKQRLDEVERVREESETQQRATHAELESLRAQLAETEESAQRERDRLMHEVTALRGELEGVNIQLNQASQQLSGTRTELDDLRFELTSRRDVERRAQQALAVALRVLDGQATS